jgi:hypothetical protein
MQRLREIQPAHKSDKITVAQAKKAWLKVERENEKPARGKEHSGSGRGASSPKKG